MKKIFLLTLVFVMMLSSNLVLAKDNPKIKWLQDNKIVEGRLLENGQVDLALEDKITRAEFTKILVDSLKLDNKVNLTFFDIKDHWAKNYIEKAANDPRTIIVGYEDGSFGPDKKVKISELAAMLVKASKKDLTEEMKKNAVWPASYLQWAEEAGIFSGLQIEDMLAEANRKTAFEMLYNALEATKTNKNSSGEHQASERGTAFDWTYNALDKLGKIDHNKTDKEKIKEIFGSSPAIEKGQKVKISVLILGSSKDGGNTISANADVKTDKTALRPENIGLDSEFNKLYYAFKADKKEFLKDANIEIDGNDKKLYGKYDPSGGILEVEILELKDVLMTSGRYEVNIYITAN